MDRNQLLLQQQAVKAFVVTLGDLSAFPDVTADTQIQWPFNIIYNKKVIPINYDKDTNIISLG